MTDAADLERELHRELLMEMIRKGLLTDEMVATVQRRFESEAELHRGSTRRHRYERLAHMAAVLPIEARSQTPADFQARQRRNRLRVVTDGGNDPS